jgi:hypothetical protein
MFLPPDYAIGSIEEGGVSRASIALPVSKHKFLDSRVTVWTPMRLEPMMFVERVRAQAFIFAAMNGNPPEPFPKQS